MGGVAADQDWGVTAADSRGDTHAYVKNGWLPRTGGWVVTSVGKVEHEGHPLLVAALSDGGGDAEEGHLGRRARRQERREGRHRRLNPTR